MESGIAYSPAPAGACPWRCAPTASAPRERRCAELGSGRGPGAHPSARRGPSTGIRDGALVIATGAVREEGVTRQLVPLSYPAVADMGVTRALQKAAAEQSEFPVHSGIVLTLDAFFPALLDLPNNLMAKAGAVAVEMECAALLVVSLRGCR